MKAQIFTVLHQLFKILTQPLAIASGAVAIFAFTVQVTTAERAAILGVFLVVGILPNAIYQFWATRRKRRHLSLANDFGEVLPVIEFYYVFSFSLLAVIYGSQLFTKPSWMFLMMAYAIYHGINLLVIKYFHAISPRTGEVVFWTTALLNLNPVYTVGYLLLIPVLWLKLEPKKLNLVAFNYSFVIGLMAALLTWIS